MKKLFISDNAPDDLKEVIRVAQKSLNNLEEYKVKADKGSLTSADLRELTRRNNLLTDEFPKSAPGKSGFPPNLKTVEDLEAHGKMRTAESADLLKKEGGPVFKINSFDQLKELSRMTPTAVGAQITSAANLRRKEQTGGPQTSVDVKAPKIPKGSLSFHEEFFLENLQIIKGLLHNAKFVFFDLPGQWSQAEIYEEKLVENARAFEDYRDAGTEFLIRVITGEEDVDNETTELKPNAAFTLATIKRENKDDLDHLLAILKNKPEMEPVIIQALKYGKNQDIPIFLEKSLPNESPEIQAGMIEILNYKNSINKELWDRLLKKNDPIVCSAILKAYVLSGIKTDPSSFISLLEQPDTSFYEEVLFTMMLDGRRESLDTARQFLHKKPDEVKNLHLYLACAGRTEDLGYMINGLNRETSRKACIMAMGILGLPQAILYLTDQLEPNEWSLEEWHVQRSIIDSLELITGANLERPLPDIKEGPEGKEYDVTIDTGWKKIWTLWWEQNKSQFDIKKRYRRGTPFQLESCLQEMENPTGNYWSRQYSYHELQIRSGHHVTPFFADWDVNDQKAAINRWKKWYEENGGVYAEPQSCMFNGEIL